jgi:hypothetical protein
MTYIAPQIFRQWTPILIENKVNKLKPTTFNIGSLPLLLWFANNNPNIMVNSCKHLGNSLKTAKIKSNCLICPFHEQSYNQSDNFGSTVIQNGIIWWSYKSYDKQPFFKSNKTSYQLELEINIDLITFIINILAENQKSSTHIWNSKKKQLLLKLEGKTIIFKYPYRLIIRDKKIKLTEELAILPLSLTKIKLFINIYNPIYIPFIYLYYLIIKNKFEQDITTSNLYIKNFFIFKNGYNNYLEKVYKSYVEFSYLTDFTINQFMINKNFY